MTTTAHPTNEANSVADLSDDELLDRLLADEITYLRGNLSPAVEQVFRRWISLYRLEADNRDLIRLDVIERYQAERTLGMHPGDCCQACAFLAETYDTPN